MTFSGSGMDDLHQILNAFPRTFTLVDVIDHFDWPSQRARQAIVNGQQSDALRVLHDGRRESGINLSVYENTRWRREWIAKPWRHCG